jgi:hypothetical protein
MSVTIIVAADNVKRRATGCTMRAPTCDGDERLEHCTNECGSQREADDET